MRLLAGSDISKQIDEFTVNETGIPSLVLMERAALAMADEICKRAERYNLSKDAVILCGSGNNGGDGAACGRILMERGFTVTVLVFEGKHGFSKSMDAQVHILENLFSDVRVFPVEMLDKELIESFNLQEYSFIVDALFGVGLARNIEGGYAKLINAVNACEAFKVSCDLPSGINADTGKIMGTAIKASLTVTMGFDKPGIVLFPGTEYAGEKVVVDIGFDPTASVMFDSHIHAFDRKKDMENIVPERKEYSNKGDFGKVLIIAGSEEMHGAAFLSGLAAYRTGAGLVRFFTSEKNRSILAALLPEALISTFGESPDEVMSDKMRADLKKALEWASVVVVGPGMGISKRSLSIIKEVTETTEVPLIIDADALSQFRKSGASVRDNFIFTPHLKEMERLSGCTVNECKADIIGISRKFVGENGGVLVLKDARSVVSGRRMPDDDFISTTVIDSGTSALAKGGSGDVLTGIIAGLAAMGEELYMAAAKGAYIHGLAGEAAEERIGKNSVLARDVADAISYVLK